MSYESINKCNTKSLFKAIVMIIKTVIIFLLFQIIKKKNGIINKNKNKKKHNKFMSITRKYKV